MGVVMTGKCGPCRLPEIMYLLTLIERVYPSDTWAKIRALLKAFSKQLFINVILNTACSLKWVHFLSSGLLLNNWWIMEYVHGITVCSIIQN